VICQAATVTIQTKIQTKTSMYPYQYVLLAGFVCLLLNKETRFAASVFLLGWAAYLLFFIDASSTYKYIACAAIETSIAYSINNRYRVVSYLGYSLIFVNIYGLMLIRGKVDPVSYDVIYGLISVAQFLFLLMRAIPNGISRLHNEHIIVRLVNFDGSQARDIMCKNKTKKETSR